ncbi:MAG: hypothetical protein IPK67_19440 [Planctomycetes bacterium]|nr:hypothetical protein [Planctomycetota bacterium]
MTSDAGTPISDLPIQVSAASGEIVSQDGAVAPGVWQLRFRAPESGERVDFLLQAGRRGSARLLLAPPPRPTLSVPAQPARAPAGQPLSLIVEGADPPPPERLGVVVGEGRVERVEALNGRLRVT